MKKIILTCLVAVLTTATAQNQKIRLTTSDNVQIIIPLENGMTASIDSSTGDIIATTTASQVEFCNTDNNQSAVQGGTCSGTVAPTAPSVDLSATVNSIPTATTPNIRYQITGTATRCVKTGASWNSEADITSSQLLTPDVIHEVTAPSSISTNTTYGLTCYNASAQGNNDTVTVFPTNTTGCPAPLNGQSGFSQDISITQLADNFPTSAVYPYIGNAYSPVISTGKFVAWQFVAGPNTKWKAFSESSNNPPTGVSFAVSECPGVFDETELENECHANGNTAINTMKFHSDVPATTNHCDLITGKTYYMNIVWAKKNTTTGSYDLGCSSQTCKMLLQNFDIR